MTDSRRLCPRCKQNPSMLGLKGRLCLQCAKDEGITAGYGVVGRIYDWLDKE